MQRWNRFAFIARWFDLKNFNVKDTTFVLHEAGRLFQEESTDDRKKIVVIFTNEFSQGRLVILPEAAVGDVLFKELYLKAPQNPLENNCVRVCF